MLRRHLPPLRRLLLARRPLLLSSHISSSDRLSSPSRPPPPPPSLISRLHSTGRPSPRRHDRRVGSRLDRGASLAPSVGVRSLIDDEAELSDWISDLKTSSIRIGLSSDSDNGGSDDRRGGRTGARVSTRGSAVESRSGPASRRGKRGDGDSGSFRVSRKPRGERFGSDIDDLDDDDDDEGFPSRRGGRRGRANNRHKDGFDDFEDDDDCGGGGELYSKSKGGRGGRNERQPGMEGRKQRGNVSFKSDSDDFDDDEDSDDVERSYVGRGRAKGNERGNTRGMDTKGRSGSQISNSASIGWPHRDGEKGPDLRERRAHVSKLKSFDFEMPTGGSNAAEDDDDLLSGLGDNDLFSEGDAEEGKVIKSAESPKLVGGDSAAVHKGSDSYLSEKRFDECDLSPLTLKGVKATGYERMTVVQEATLPIILKGKDVLAKAKTGTGKTVAFLLPAIEVVSKLPPVDRDNRVTPINVLVVCPTRELADQAAAEAGKLLRHHPSIGVQLVIGGTRLTLEQKRLQTNPCQILVSTPGRLKDHIENTPGFQTRLKGVKVLVLDEADRLLDMGFRSDIEHIIDSLPKQRQTLLFSATVPDEVRQVCFVAMRRDFEFVNTVEEGSEETHSHVKQMHLVAPLEKQFSVLYRLLTEHISDNVDYKVIVFCTTAMVTRLVAELLSELKLNVREIHSRKPQSYRQRISKEFRESKGLILVSSDVSARGVDYPDVSLVVQLGVPADREQYIHRLGRTGRKGKEGAGILLLAPWEGFFLRTIKDLPVTEESLPVVDPDTRKKVDKALAHVEMTDKEKAYQAWLGYYNSNKNVANDKYKLVLLANEFSRSLGLDNPPALPKHIVGKMGLSNIPGLRSR